MNHGNPCVGQGDSGIQAADRHIVPGLEVFALGCSRAQAPSDKRNRLLGKDIGQKGSMLKAIGTQARADIERLIGTKVFLELFVRVTKDWSKDKHELKRLGYK